MNPYLELTSAFNQGAWRAVVSSGQAVVLPRLSLSRALSGLPLREQHARLVEAALGVLPFEVPGAQA